MRARALARISFQRALLLVMICRVSALSALLSYAYVYVRVLSAGPPPCYMSTQAEQELGALQLKYDKLLERLSREATRRRNEVRQPRAALRARADARLVHRASAQGEV